MTINKKESKRTCVVDAVVNRKIITNVNVWVKLGKGPVVLILHSKLNNIFKMKKQTHS